MLLLPCYEDAANKDPNTVDSPFLCLENTTVFLAVPENIVS